MPPCLGILEIGVLTRNNVHSDILESCYSISYGWQKQQETENENMIVNQRARINKEGCQTVIGESGVEIS